MWQQNVQTYLKQVWFSTVQKWLIVVILLFCSTILAPVLYAQTGPVNYTEIPIQYESATYSKDADADGGIEPESTYLVQSDGASWIRVQFGELYLDQKSYLILTSDEDGATQRITNQWKARGHTQSIYFNGDAVSVELFVAPGDTNVYFNVESCLAGTPAPNQRSLCGDDSRTRSYNDAVGRVTPIGATAWIAESGLLVTAGHVAVDFDENTIIEFNVEESSNDGDLDHPGIEHQYYPKLSDCCG